MSAFTAGRAICLWCVRAPPAPIARTDRVVRQHPAAELPRAARPLQRCGAAISWRYPAVELITALSFVYFAHHGGLSLLTLKYCAFTAIMIALIFADLETLLLPDELTIGGFVIGLIFALFVPIPNRQFDEIVTILGIYPGPRVMNLAKRCAAPSCLPAASGSEAGFLKNCATKKASVSAT